MPLARESRVSNGARTAHRSLAPDDLYRLRVPSQVRLAPDGLVVVFSVQSTTARRDGYVHSIWGVPTDGSEEPRQLTRGAWHDTSPRISPDGRLLAFLSDRRTHVETAPAKETPAASGKREDVVQVYVLPLNRPGEALRVTDLPRGVTSFEWSPDGKRLAVLSPSAGATKDEDRRRRGLDEPAANGMPTSDYRYVDRLSFLHNGRGFVYDSRPQLWVVDLDPGDVRRLTNVDWSVDMPAWSPDGTRIAYCTDERRDADFDPRSHIFVVDVDSGSRTRITDAGRADFSAPTWLPDGRTIACLGHRYPAHAGSRSDVWLFTADGSDSGRDGGRNLSACHDLMPATSMNSDITPGEPARLVASADGAWLTFSAPCDGSYELWRISTDEGRLERLTEGREYISGFDQIEVDGRRRLAFIRSTPTDLPDVWAQSDGEAPRRLSSLNDVVLDDVELVEPVERSYEVDGRLIQGWLIEPAESSGFRRPGPLAVEIHGGPQTQYGWSPVLEFQVLAGTGMSVFYCNPRGSTGYGQWFADANFRDWGDGPTRDVLAGVDALVAEGIADSRHLGVTGGSYGGYLTNWIIGHDRRFAAAFTARSVSDMTSLMLTGDLAGVDPKMFIGANPWEEPEFYRDASPITYIASCTTPLLIQHAEEDLRCPIGQAEELFAVLRAHRRPVRFMRVPAENHELTRGGTPFRRVENLTQVRDWFRHYLVYGKRRLRRLPPLPHARAGK
jgi:dipeptidyl aminopeptidase/acylaminoacyl peptidase